MWLDQTSVPQAGLADDPVLGFLAHIVQTVPTACDQTFSNVQTLWSGDFMNFSGQNDQWQFHLLAGGDDDVEVYALGARGDSGPVDVAPNALSCRVFTN